MAYTTHLQKHYCDSIDRQAISVLSFGRLARMTWPHCNLWQIECKESGTLPLPKLVSGVTKRTLDNLELKDSRQLHQLTHFKKQISQLILWIPARFLQGVLLWMSQKYASDTHPIHQT